MPRRRKLTTSLALVVACALASIAASHGDLAQRLANADRSAEEKARDAGRKPAEVVEFLGITAGVTVIDVIAAGGYYTEVLSVAVGEKGKVYAQNPAAVLKFRDGANDKAMTARLAGERLANVERLDVEMADLAIPNDSLDAAITALNIHDVYNGRGEDVARTLLLGVYAKLKPGGVLGIIDHAGIASQDNKKLHRIERQRVLDTIAKTPFELEAESDLLANEDDDHTKNVFAPNMRGNTDRFLLRLRKPAA
jgi:predicted methyltransferase